MAAQNQLEITARVTHREPKAFPKKDGSGEMTNPKYFFDFDTPQGKMKMSTWDTKAWEQLQEGNTATVWYTETSNPNSPYPYRDIVTWKLGDEEDQAFVDAMEELAESPQDDRTEEFWGGMDRSTVNPVPQPTPPVVVPSPQTYMADHPSKRESIERQVALGKAIEFYQANGDKANILPGESPTLYVLTMSEKFYQWISQRGFEGAEEYWCSRHMRHFDKVSPKSGLHYHDADAQNGERYACVVGQEELVKV